jgi:phosphoesterase RecJ-like protein
MKEVKAAIGERLLSAQHILIASHVRPDGDAIGSLLSMGLALQNQGKTVQMVLSDGIPASFRHLPGSEQVKTSHTGEPDTTIAVDCSDFQRTGDALAAFAQPDIVIDHHVTNDAFGTLNLIEIDAVATASVLMRHMPAWGMEITAAIAANLLTGLITDTLGFRTSNTTPECLRQAAELMEKGANINDIYYRSLVRRTFPAARYWGAGLSSLQRADGIVWATLTLEARKASGYGGNDDADLINVVSAVDESEITMMFVEQKNGTVKISWRASRPQIDVSAIAVQFGGGGHKAAAGAEIEGSLPDVQERVLAVTRNVLSNQIGN